VVASVVDETEFGFGWIAPEPLFMRRCSHALVVDGAVWLLDPVEDRAMLARACGLGEPTGVIQLLDRHQRDCARVASELGVVHHRVPTAPPLGAPFEVAPIVRIPRWHEIALWFPALNTLVCADALGTAQYYRAPAERLAVSPLLRLTPPRRLLAYEPKHVLVGHGEGVHHDATAALRDAIELARRRTRSWLAAGMRAHMRPGLRRL